MAKKNGAKSYEEMSEEETTERAVAETDADETAAFDTSTFAEEAVGLPPYWTVEAGKRFCGTVVNYEPPRVDQNGEEEMRGRYTIQASCKHICHRGPRDKQETVPVEKGEFFSVSDYGGLSLARFFGLEIVATAKEKIKLSGARTHWKFQIMVPPEAKRLLDSKRAELIAAAKAMRFSAPPPEAPKLPPVSAKAD